MVECRNNDNDGGGGFMDKVENKQGEHKGTWVAAVGGAGVGASVAATGGFALKAKRGLKGVVVDQVHAYMDHFESPEKLEKFVKGNFEAIQSKLGVLETGLDHPHLQNVIRNKFPEYHMGVLEEQAKRLINAGGVDANVEELTSHIAEKFPNSMNPFEDFIKLKQSKNMYTHVDVNKITNHGEEVNRFLIEAKKNIAEVKVMKFDTVTQGESFKEVLAVLSNDSKDFKKALESVGLNRSFMSKIPGGVASLATVGGVVGAAMAFHIVEGMHESIDRQGQNGGRVVQ